VGVWDTVGSVFNTIDALSIKDTYLPQSIDFAIHGLSLQENRQRFLPTLWTTPTTGLASTPSGSPQVLKQVGLHSLLYCMNHELSFGRFGFPERIPTLVEDTSVMSFLTSRYSGWRYGSTFIPRLLIPVWHPLKGEIEGFINLDLDFIQQSGQPNPDPWGESQPHNAFEELPIPEQVIIGLENRLQSSQITATSIFHPSLAVAPTKLSNPIGMVTMDTLKGKFGLLWTPTYSQLNSFEQRCKDNWGHGVVCNSVSRVPHLCTKSWRSIAEWPDDGWQCPIRNALSPFWFI
jgi:hypothetical protein